MIQAAQRYLLTKLADNADKVIKTQRYQLGEQLIEHNLLSKKNKVRIAKLREEKRKRHLEHIEKKQKLIKNKEKQIKFNELHHLEKQLQNLTQVFGEVKEELSQKEIKSYTKRISEYKKIIEQKKEELR
jgi:glycerol-3-phosphate cytidylyltransferase-like family protein